MKKKSFSVIIVAVIAIAATWNLIHNDKEVPLSDIVLNNVEALANQQPVADCPGGRHLCATGPGTRLYDRELPNDI